MIGLRRIVVRNVTVQSLAEGVGLVCGLIASVVLSRHLGVDGFGAFNYAFAFIYFFLALNDLGLNTIAVREMSQAPERRADTLSALLSLRLVLAAIVLCVAWSAIALWPMEPGLRLPLSVFALILPLSALNVPSVMFHVAMRFELAAAALIVNRVSGVLLILALVATGQGVTAMLAALLAAEILGLCATWWLAGRLVQIRWRVDPAMWRKLLAAAVPLAASLLLVTIVSRADFIMLERLASLEDVGLYGAAYRVTGLLEKFPLFAMATLYPVMSQLAVTDRPRLRHVYRNALWRLAALGGAGVAVVAVIAPDLLAVGFGESFRAAAPTLRWLLVATACMYLALTGGNLLIAVGRAGLNTVALAIGAAINIALNFILIPSHGIAGAAMATAASMGVVLVITVVAVERYFALERAR